MQNSLYAKYILERENKHYFENKYGFVTYTIGSDNIYLQDMYVLQECRGKGHARNFLNYIEKIALELNKSCIVTSISINAQNPEISIIPIICGDFKIKKLDEKNSMIYFIKRLD
tara:strand:- start:12966 stop:13307 length:342 start_codon:yes stop_codon:yes gene_type:complete